MGLTAGSAATGPTATTVTVEGEQFDVEAAITGAFRGIWMNEPSLSMLCDRTRDSDFKGGARRHGDVLRISLMQRFRVTSGLPINEQDDQVRSVDMQLYEPRGIDQGRDPFTMTIYQEPAKQAEIEEQKARTLHDEIEASIGVEMRSGYWFGRSPMRETLDSDGSVTARTLTSAGRDCAPGNYDDNKLSTELKADLLARAIRGKPFCAAVDNFTMASMARDQMYAPIENPLANQGYRTGQMKGERKAGWKMLETVHAGTHTFGKVGGVQQVRVAPAEGASTVACTIPNGDSVTENTRIRFRGVNAVNELNGKEAPTPMWFRVTETATGNSSNQANVSIDPPLRSAAAGGEALRTSRCSKLPTAGTQIFHFSADTNIAADRAAISEKNVPLSFFVQQDSTMLTFSRPQMPSDSGVGYRTVESNTAKYSITFAKQFDVDTFRQKWRLIARWAAKVILQEAGYEVTGKVTN